jgi:CRISPR/Cas system-associated exonuclease Cas4 (RecB family)
VTIESTLKAREHPHQRGTPLETVSLAQLTTWLSCPLKFKFMYKEGIKEPTSPRMFLGRRVHDALHFYYQNRIEGLTPSPDTVKQYVQATWPIAMASEQPQFDSGAEQDALQQQCLGLIETYFEQSDIENEGTPIASNQTWNLPLVAPGTSDKVAANITGAFDLVLISEHGPVVVDFRASSRKDSSPDVAHEIKLACYAYAFRELYGESEVELQIRSLIRTKTPKMQVRRFLMRTTKHFHRLFAVIRAHLNDVRSNRYIYRPGWPCSQCTYRETHCAAWEGESQTNIYRKEDVWN